ncbi:MAG: hypothetical protein K1000chlam3_01514, partial [Chlamydiae bacterium]|nr:hypothetical protein [Chlamydiota bacterium]
QNANHNQTNVQEDPNETKIKKVLSMLMDEMKEGQKPRDNQTHSNIQNFDNALDTVKTALLLKNLKNPKK